MERTISVIVTVSFFVTKLRAGNDICSSFYMDHIRSGFNDDGNIIDFCRNSSDGTVRGVTHLTGNWLLITQDKYETEEKPQICSKSESSSKRSHWICNPVSFHFPSSENVLNYIRHKSRVPRQATDSKLVLPHLAKKNVNFSVLNVAGIDWVCEQLSETQCKPLWPKINKKTEEQNLPQPRALTTKQQEQPYSGSNQYLTDDRIDSISKIVNDDDRWQWSQGRGVTGGRNQQLEQPETSNSAQSETIINPQQSANGTGQYVYNINGITWLCRQFKQLQCYPIFSPWDGKGDPPGLSTASPGFQYQPGLNRQDPGYPDYPREKGFQESPSKVTSAPIVPSRRVDNNWENQHIGQSTLTSASIGPQLRPPHKRTTFCSRSIRFKAKDEVVLKYNTYKGTMRMYIQAIRQINRQVVLNAKMLEENEEGLGAEENNPAVIIAADVNCDTITLTVEDQVFKIDYNFGRSGVKDLEVIGNLESTGMVPRSKTLSNGGRRHISNFIEIDDFAEIQLRPSSTTINDNNESNLVNENIVDDTTVNSELDNEDEDSSPVTEDNFQIDGQGDVQVSLGEGLNKQHRYQISRGSDGEVNIEVLVGEETDNAEKSLVIDNKDYNYTLIVTGQNFQIIHHDTNRNLTYKHGLNEKDILGVDISGDLHGTSTRFKEKPAVSGILNPQKRVLQGVSIFGNLCLSQCLVTSDNRYYCEVHGGKSEQCGPEPNLTPLGEPCADECRKRDDDYFWCQRDKKPWDYCSPPLIFQQKLDCPEGADKMMTPDPTDCARYLSCESGSIKLEECPEGLHYIHKNKTCEWPTGGQCSDPFGRSNFERNPPSTTSFKPKPQPILTSTSNAIDVYTARTTPTNIKSSTRYSTLPRGKTNEPQISIEEVYTYQTTAAEPSNKNTENGRETTLSDFLDYLDSTRDDELLDKIEVQLDHLTTPEYISKNIEEPLKQSTSARYPSTSFNEGKYYSSSSSTPIKEGDIKSVPQTFQTQTIGFPTRGIFQDSLGRTKQNSITPEDASLIYTSPVYTQDNLVTKANPINTEPELLITSEDANRPTVWVQTSTQQYPSQPLTFPSISQSIPLTASTSERGRVRFPTTEQFEDDTLPAVTITKEARTQQTVNEAQTFYGTTTNQNIGNPLTLSRFPQTNTQPNIPSNTGVESRTIPDTTLSRSNSPQYNTDRSFPRSLFGDGNPNSITEKTGDDLFGVSQTLFADNFPSTSTSRPIPIVNPATKSPEIEIDTQAILAKARNFKDGLTSHGELCTDACEKRGYPYYWCHKKSSNLGQWWDSDFCSPFSTVTHYGKECEDECEQRGEKYFWCHRKIDGGWGYCSPNTVYKEGVCTSNNGFGDGFYAIVGDCERYISCRGGRPIIFSCEKTLYFDYILQSCTFKKDARCIGVE